MTGRITPDNLQPHPKNPTISDFFRQLGWVEDLGSGIRKMFQYGPIYVKGALPVIEEGDVFKLTVRYEKESSSEKLNTATATKYADKILELIKVNAKITITEMAQELSISKSTVDRTLAKLVEDKVIEREGSDKAGQWAFVNHKKNK